MKAYTTHISLAGAALALMGALALALDPEETGVQLACLGAGVLVIAVCAAINPALFKQYSSWLNALWGSILVLLIVVMVNFVTSSHPQRYDLTAGKLHSLSPLTVESLQGLDSDVRVLAFMEKGENEKLESLLEQYSTYSGSFDFELVDPDRDPRRTSDYGIRRYNTVVVESGEKQQKVTELTEKELTNAMLKVTRDRQSFVYLTVGHGEKGVSQTELGLSRLRDRLQEIDYVVEDSLFLARAGEVPGDCAVLVIAGPQSPFFSTEAEAIARYLDAGGSVIALLDPANESGLEALFASWGVELGDDFVIDTSGIGSLFGLDFTIPVAVSYDQEHPLVSKHRSGTMTFFELARSVRFVGTESVEGVELVTTSSQSWAERDLSALQPGQGKRTVSLDEGVDRAGPVALGVAAKREEGGRLVLFGDSDFASNRYFDLQGNGDLILNAISWLAADEGLISIRPREAGFNPIALTDSQSEWIFWVGVILYPLAVALAGFFVVSSKGRWSVRDLLAAGLGLALSLGIVTLVNFIGDRYHSRLDLTADGLFTLSPKTRDLLERAERQDRLISVKAFTSEIESMRFRELMDEYSYETRNFVYEIVDPQQRSLEWKQHGVTVRGTSLVEVSGDGKVHSERIEEQTEEALSNAIKSALDARERRIAFIGGHGEGMLTEVGGEGFSILNGRLKELNLQIDEGVRLDGAPIAAQTLVLLGPKQPLSAVEAVAFEALLRKGKDALVLTDPGVDTGLESVLEGYGIELGNDFVVDLSGIGQLLGADVSVPVVIQYGNHPTTAKIGSGTMSFFPFARSVTPAADEVAGSEITALAFTHRSSWGETDLSPLAGEGGQVEFDPEKDRQGPLSLAVAVKADPDSAASGDKTRLAVFGDSDFARNQYFGQQANGELLIGALKWVTESEDRLAIPVKRPAFNPINLVGNQGDVVLWVSVFVLPFAVALSGFVIMLRRGYAAYSSGFVRWLMYSHFSAATGLFGLATVAVADGNTLAGLGYFILSVGLAMTGYGLHRREPWSWPAALTFSALVVGVGFAAIPHETLQLVSAGWWIANACILVWIKSDFTPKTGTEK